MSIVLIVTRDDQKKGLIELGDLMYLIGRTDNCHVKLDDPHVSKEHARIFAEMNGTVHLVRDEGGKNGTRLNRITTPNLERFRAAVQVTLNLSFAGVVKTSIAPMAMW